MTLLYLYEDGHLGFVMGFKFGKNVKVLCRLLRTVNGEIGNDNGMTYP